MTKFHHFDSKITKFSCPHTPLKLDALQHDWLRMLPEALIQIELDLQHSTDDGEVLNLEYKDQARVNHFFLILKEENRRL